MNGSVAERRIAGLSPAELAALAELWRRGLRWFERRFDILRFFFLLSLSHVLSVLSGGRGSDKWLLHSFRSFFLRWPAWHKGKLGALQGPG